MSWPVRIATLSKGGWFAPYGYTVLSDYDEAPLIEVIDGVTYYFVELF